MPRYDFTRFVSARNAYSPSPSPDGSRIAFLYDITGVPQVWSVPTEGGWPEQLTFFADRVTAIAYSPAGDRIMFGIDAGGNERRQLYSVTPDGADVEPLAVDPAVIHSWGEWSPDAQQLAGLWSPGGARIAYAANARDQRFFDIYVRTLGDGAQMVYQQDGTNSVVGWSLDSESLLISRADSKVNNNLLLLDLTTGACQHLTEHAGDVLYRNARFIGADRLVLLSDLDREFLAPATLDLHTGEIHFLAETQWDAEELTASRDGGILAYVVNEEGYSRLHLTADGKPVIVSGLPDGVVVGLKLSVDARLLVFTMHGPTAGQNVWAIETATGRAWQVTHTTCAGIPTARLVEPRLIHYTSFDGLRVPAFLYLPPEATPPQPVIMFVHGGPESQTRPVFNATIQYLVHRGFAVLAPNVRGSVGYGKTYSHLDDRRRRMDAVADLEAAVRWLRESGTAQADRIAVMGGSYGGFMVLAALTTYPDLWAAGVDSFGPVNFVTHFSNMGPWRRKLREAEYGSLEQDREFLEAISPIRQIDRITAPLLVIHGENDPRVVIGESEQVVERLRALGREVEFQRYDDEGHGFAKLPNIIHSAEATAAFLDKYLGSR